LKYDYKISILAGNSFKILFLCCAWFVYLHLSIWIDGLTAFWGCAALTRVNADIPT
jgi:hypothetical protein